MKPLQIAEEEKQNWVLIEEKLPPFNKDLMLKYQVVVNEDRDFRVLECTKIRGYLNMYGEFPNVSNLIWVHTFFSKISGKWDYAIIEENKTRRVSHWRELTEEEKNND